MTRRANRRTVLYGFSLCLILLLLAGFWPTQMSRATDSSPEIRVPVLVELFTSEGCSSCPPADRLLINLEQTQPVPGAQIIALGQHVDYWNQLGWKDVFSSAEVTERQQQYAEALNSGVYTPQMVVDGQYEFVGSDAGDARQAIAKSARSPKAQVEIYGEWPDGATRLPIRVDVKSVPETGRDDSADVFLAVTESALTSQVARGENSGRQLTHTAVVRRLLRLGTLDPKRSDGFSAKADLELTPIWRRENLRLVAFVQQRSSRHILGATERRLNPRSAAFSGRSHGIPTLGSIFISAIMGLFGRGVL